jgi:hypothetical protein
MISVKDMLGDVWKEYVAYYEQWLILLGIRNYNPQTKLEGHMRWEFGMLMFVYSLFFLFSVLAKSYLTQQRDELI